MIEDATQTTLRDNEDKARAIGTAEVNFSKSDRDMRRERRGEGQGAESAVAVRYIQYTVGICTNVSAVESGLLTSVQHSQMSTCASAKSFSVVTRTRTAHKIAISLWLFRLGQSECQSGQLIQPRTRRGRWR